MDVALESIVKVPVQLTPLLTTPLTMVYVPELQGYVNPVALLVAGNPILRTATTKNNETTPRILFVLRTIRLSPKSMTY
jgi:hypothetical protein